MDPSGSALSQLCGVIYVVCWTAAHYPQVWLNFRRKSVAGYSLDFMVYNVVGFSAYAIYCVVDYSLEWQYGLIAAVTWQDVAFAIHSLLGTFFMVYQAAIYDRGPQKVGTVAIAISSVLTIFMLVNCGLASLGLLAWVDYSSSPHSLDGTGEYVYTYWSVVDFLGFTKAAITVIKYVPQVHMNFKNRSTKGLSMPQIWLDLGGGIFSVLQNVIDAIDESDMDYIYRNMPKLCIGASSIMYDVIILSQHWYYDGMNHRARPIKYTEVQESEAGRISPRIIGCTGNRIDQMRKEEGSA